jgi:hypothetical protein
LTGRSAVIIFRALKSIEDRRVSEVLIANIMLAVALSLLFILLAISMIAVLVAFANHLLFLLLSGAAELNTLKPNPALCKWLVSDAVMLQQPKPSEKVPS